MKTRRVISSKASAIGRLSLVSLFLLLLWSLFFAFSARPMQDDYVYLNLLSRNGYSGLISYLWNTNGGNLASPLIRMIFYVPSLSGTSYVGLMLLSLITQLLVFICAILVSIWISGKPFLHHSGLHILCGATTVFGFEGIFTPGLTGSYNFSAAAGLHVWPILLSIIAAAFLFNKPGFIFFAFPLGIFIGNCGLAEGLTSFIVFFFITVIPHRFSWSRLFPNTQRLASAMLAFGIFSGLSITLISPGIRIRSKAQVGIPRDFFEFMRNLRSAVVAFTGDILSHPGWVLIFILGCYFSSRFGTSSIQVRRISFLFLVVAILLMGLILGAAFGYAAWHQSLGIYTLLTESFFYLGIVFARKKEIAYQRILLVCMILLITIQSLLVVRATILAQSRSFRWDSNLAINSCNIYSGNTDDLLGAELTYPPLGLGVTDIARWTWMKNDYISWVSTKNFRSKTSC